MIIYNITTKVHFSIQHEWLGWLTQEQIPAILATGCFTNAHILQLLETDDADGPTYAVQYHAESKALYNLYIEKFAGQMKQKAFAKWGDQFIAFTSVLRVVR